MNGNEESVCSRTGGFGYRAEGCGLRCSETHRGWLRKALSLRIQECVTLACSSRTELPPVQTPALVAQENHEQEEWLYQCSHDAHTTKNWGKPPCEPGHHVARVVVDERDDSHRDERALACEASLVGATGVSCPRRLACNFRVMGVGLRV